MPSVEKAIINPFEPLSVGEALLVAASGLLVVFVMLAMLMAVIWVISKIVATIEGKKPTAAPAAKKAAAPAPAAAPAAPAVDEGELVAVMMAAIAEDSGMSPNSFRITSVSAAPAAAPVAAAPVAAPVLSGAGGSEESEKPAPARGIFADGFDPKMAVLYAEVMRPKFQEY